MHSQPHKRGTKALNIFLPIILLAVALGLYGARMLLAGLNHSQAQAFAEHWLRQGKVPAIDEWTRINKAAQRANQLYPVANAQYLQLLGENWLWRQYGQTLDSPDPLIRDARIAASEAFEQATLVRPLWPGHWAGLARAQASRMDYSVTFLHALARTIQTGRNRPGINTQLAETALQSWQWLDSESRTLGARAIRFSVQTRPARMQMLAAIAEQAGSKPALCDSIQDLQLPAREQQVKKRLCPAHNGMN